ncbi:MAG: hypothetical protein GF411_16765 [Candidatus Lokiarchaeota archaeon]|nr:hypothetical protein [Candidatus Lokiarchaeota archaeon]
MKVIPAIDLMSNSVVRLYQGNPSQRTNYSKWGTPQKVLDNWIDVGVDTIQLIDLDAATGRGSNLPLILDMLESSSVSLQIGGGIRDYQSASYLLRYDNCKIIVGSMALTNLSCLLRLKEDYGSERIIISLDYIDNSIRIDGWKKSTTIQVGAAIDLFSKCDFQTYLVTAIERDGTLSGCDVDVFRHLCKTTSVNILAAGGVSSLHDLRELAGVGVYGAIIGRALYEGLVTLEEVILALEVTS